jgi:hypothetical protein
VTLFLVAHPEQVAQHQVMDNLLGGESWSYGQKTHLRFRGRGVYPTEGSCRFPLIVLQQTTQSFLATHNSVIPARPRDSTIRPFETRPVGEGHSRGGPHWEWSQVAYLPLHCKIIRLNCNAIQTLLKSNSNNYTSCVIFFYIAVATRRNLSRLFATSGRI